MKMHGGRFIDCVLKQMFYQKNVLMEFPQYDIHWIFPTILWYGKLNNLPYNDNLFHPHRCDYIINCS